MKSTAPSFNDPGAVFIWILLMFAAAMPMLLDQSQWLLWVLIYMSFAALFIDQNLLRDKSLHLTTCLVILLHHIVSFADYYWNPVTGGGIDARTFHDAAVNLATTGRLELSIGYLFYENLLGSVYLIGGTSQLLGRTLSVLAFSLSIVVFVKFFYLFHIEKYAALAVGLYGLWPSGLIYTTGIYRESFELLFFLMAVYGGMRLQASRQYRWFLYTVLSLVGLSLWHKALIIYSMFFILLVLFFTWLRQNHQRSSRMSLKLPILFVVSIIGVTVFALNATHVGRALVLDSLSGDIIQNIVNYRNWTDNLGSPRTAFNIDMDISSVAGSIGSFVEVYVYYLFAPFAGEISGVKDIYAVFESSTRMALIVLAVLSTWAKNDRLDFVVLWCVYISMTFMWAIGTTNYGQSIRHHAVSNWVLILMAWPMVLFMLQSVCKRPRHPA